MDKLNFRKLVEECEGLGAREVVGSMELLQNNFPSTFLTLFRLTHSREGVFLRKVTDTSHIVTKIHYLVIGQRHVTCQETLPGPQQRGQSPVEAVG